MSAMNDKEKVHRVLLRDQIRRRALTTVQDATQVFMKISPYAYRQLVRELNDSIGMNAYEVAYLENKANDIAELEIFVPQHMAIMLKLRWAGK
jgi:hypothetical protein